MPEGDGTPEKQCPLLRPAVSPVSGEASVVVEPALDCARGVYSPGCGRRVFDGDESGKLMTLDIAGTCLATHDAVTAVGAKKYCETADHAANCPVYPEKYKLAATQADQYKFPLPLNVPLKPGVVIKTIGVCEGNAPSELVNNFSRKVLIQTKDGRAINSILVHVYYEGYRFLDGIFHFSEKVRGDGHGAASDRYLTGDEVETITFLE